jgi:ribonuclease HII
MGVKDSKVLSARRRTALAEQILPLAKAVAFEKISAKDIDGLRREGVNLNEIELRAFVSVARELAPLELYVDAADVNQTRFGTNIGIRTGLQEQGCRIVSEHKADSKYAIVSAASILAKVERDRIIEELHVTYGDFGSGYPSDSKSIAFVQSFIEVNNVLPDIVRTTWESVTKLGYNGGTVQTRLDV